MSRIKFQLPLWLIVTLSSVFIVRIPSLFEPFYYGDEMIYLALGQGIRKGLILYKNIHDNKPPLLYFLASISGNVFWFRAILCFWIIATIILFWYFVKSIIKNNATVIAATISFAVLTSMPLLEGEVANAELFMLLPTIAACFVAWKGKGYRSAFISGLLLSIAALFKIPSIFDVGAVIAIWFFTLKFNKKDITTFILKVVTLFMGISIPIGITFLWYFIRGAGNEYLVAAFLQNFGYVSSWRAVGEQVPFLVKNGPLLIRALVVVLSFLILFFLRKKRSRLFIFTCAWAVTSLFAATLSERPYPHYLVQVIPSVSLLVGLLFTDETLEQVLTIFPLIGVFFVAVYFQFWQYSTSLYFGRFITLLTKNTHEYFESFSPTVERNYEIAKLITTTTNVSDPVFIWGDSAGIYALSQRLPPIKYVADYHIKDFSSVEETITALEMNHPKMLVFLPESPTPEALSRFAKRYYYPMQSISGALVWYNTSQ